MATQDSKLIGFACPPFCNDHLARIALYLRHRRGSQWRLTDCKLVGIGGAEARRFGLKEYLHTKKDVFLKLLVTDLYK